MEWHRLWLVLACLIRLANHFLVVQNGPLKCFYLRVVLVVVEVGGGGDARQTCLDTLSRHEET